MPGICDQCHRIGYKPKATLDDYECQVQPHRDRHPGIDALGRDAMGMTMPVVVRVSVAVPMAGVVVVMRIVVLMGMLVGMVMATMLVFFHRPHLTSVAQMSAYTAVVANMGTSGRITKGGAYRPPVSGKCRPRGPSESEVA